MLIEDKICIKIMFGVGNDKHVSDTDSQHQSLKLNIKN